MLVEAEAMSARESRWKRFQAWVVVGAGLWLMGTTLGFALSHPRATQTQVFLWTPWIITLQWEGLEP